MRLTMRIAGWAMAATMMAGPVMAATAPPIELAPSTPWEMRYDDDSCYRARAFGEGKERIVLRLTRFEPGSNFDLLVAGEPVKAESTNVELAARFHGVGESAPPGSIAMRSGTVGDAPMLIGGFARLDNLVIEGRKGVGFGKPWPNVPVEREAAVTRFTFRAPTGKTYSLRLGSLAAPMAAMRACTTDLVKLWGFDPEQQSKLTRGAKLLNLDQIAQTLRDKFPTHLDGLGINARIRVRISVTADGKATDCHIQSAASPKTLVAKVCAQIMPQMRFEPALDAAGLPLASYYVTVLQYAVW